MRRSRCAEVRTCQLPARSAIISEIAGAGGVC
jgi:hypothetical protein